MIDVTDIHFASISTDPPPQGKSVRMICYVHFLLNQSIKVAGCKIIERIDDDGRSSRFLAFPSLKSRFRCACGNSNDVGSRYCNACGCPVRTPDDASMRPADVIYPVNAETRHQIENVVFWAWNKFSEAGYSYSACEDGYSFKTTYRPPGLSSRVRQLLRSEA